MSSGTETWLFSLPSHRLHPLGPTLPMMLGFFFFFLLPLFQSFYCFLFFFSLLLPYSLSLLFFTFCLSPAAQRCFSFPVSLSWSASVSSPNFSDLFPALVFLSAPVMSYAVSLPSSPLPSVLFSLFLSLISLPFSCSLPSGAVKALTRGSSVQTPARTPSSYAF